MTSKSSSVSSTTSTAPRSVFVGEEEFEPIQSPLESEFTDMKNVLARQKGFSKDEFLNQSSLESFSNQESFMKLSQVQKVVFLKRVVELLRDNPSVGDIQKTKDRLALWQTYLDTFQKRKRKAKIPVVAPQKQTDMEFFASLPEKLEDWSWEECYLFLSKLMDENDIQRMAYYSREVDNNADALMAAEKKLTDARQERFDYVAKVMVNLQKQFAALIHYDTAVLKETDINTFLRLEEQVANAHKEVDNLHKAVDMFNWSARAASSTAQQFRRAYHNTFPDDIDNPSNSKVIRWLIQNDFLKNVYHRSPGKQREDAVRVLVAGLLELQKQLDWLKTLRFGNVPAQCDVDLGVKRAHDQTVDLYVKTELAQLKERTARKDRAGHKVEQDKAGRKYEDFEITQAEFEDEWKRYSRREIGFIPNFLMRHVTADQLRLKFPLLTQPASLQYDGGCPMNYQRVGECCVWKKHTSNVGKAKLKFASLIVSSARQSGRLLVGLFSQKEYAYILDDMKNYKPQGEAIQKEIAFEDSQALEKILTMKFNAAEVQSASVLWSNIQEDVVLQPGDQPSFLNLLHGWFHIHLINLLQPLYNADKQGFLYEEQIGDRKEASLEKKEQPQPEKKEEKKEVTTQVPVEINALTDKDEKDIRVKTIKIRDFFSHVQIIRITRQLKDPAYILANTIIFAWIHSATLRWHLYQAFELYTRQICRSMAVLGSVKKQAMSLNDFMEKHIGVIVPLLTNLTPMQTFLARSFDIFMAPLERAIQRKDVNEVVLKHFKLTLIEIERTILANLAGCFARMLEYDPETAVAHFLHLCGGKKQNKHDPKVPPSLAASFERVIEQAATYRSTFEDIEEEMKLTATMSDLKHRYDVKSCTTTPSQVSPDIQKDIDQLQYLKGLTTDEERKKTQCEYLTKFGNRSLLWRIFFAK